MSTDISTARVKIDSYNDYIPGFSTLANLINLIQKIVLSALSKSKSSSHHYQNIVSNNYYYAYINQKSWGRCLLCCLPIIGNVAIISHDWIKGKMSTSDFSAKMDRVNELIDQVGTNHFAIRELEEHPSCQEHHICNAIRLKPMAYFYLTKDIYKNSDVVRTEAANADPFIKGCLERQKV